jgi:iron(III) transport system permease protein
MAVLPAALGRSRRARRTPALTIGAALLVTALGLLPLAYVVQGSLETGWSASRELVFRPRVGELLANSSLLCVSCVAATVVIGTGTATC